MTPLNKRGEATIDFLSASFGDGTLKKKVADMLKNKDEFEKEHVTIESVNQCRWGGATPYHCKDCRSGVRESTYLLDTPPKRMIYDVSQCYQKQHGKRINALAKTSGLTEKQRSFTFDNYRCDKNNQHVFDYLKNWVESYAEDNSKCISWIYICAEYSNENKGGNGTGKTYSTCAVVNSLCENGIQTLFCRTVDMLDTLRSSYSDGGEDELPLMNRYINVPVLALDDFGKEQLSGWGAEKLYSIVDGRLSRGLPLIMNSNYSLDDMYTNPWKFIKKDAGEKAEGHIRAIVSRIGDNSEIFTLGGRDRRLFK